MYAVLKTGGKEYRVSKGDLLRIERMEGKVGDRVVLKDVLMVSVSQRSSDIRNHAI